MPGLQEVAQILAKFDGNETLHERDDRQHLARVSEEAEAEQVPLPQTTEIPVVIDTPSPALRIEQETQALLRDGTNHIETIRFKLRITRDNSFRRCCFATSPLFHIRGGIVRQIAAARRLLTVGSSVGIRPPKPAHDVPLFVPIFIDAPLRRYRRGESASTAPNDGPHMLSHWRLLRSPHRVTSTCLGAFTVA